MPGPPPRTRAVAAAPPAAEAAPPGDGRRAVGYTLTELSDCPRTPTWDSGAATPRRSRRCEKGRRYWTWDRAPASTASWPPGRSGRPGKVIGVDMTPEMIARARANADEGRATPTWSSVSVRSRRSRGRRHRGRHHLQLRAQPEPGEGPGARRGVPRAQARRTHGGLRHGVGPRVPEVVAGSLDAVAACLPTPGQRTWTSSAAPASPTCASPRRSRTPPATSWPTRAWTPSWRRTPRRGTSWRRSRLHLRGPLRGHPQDRPRVPCRPTPPAPRPRPVSACRSAPRRCPRTVRTGTVRRWG